MSVTVKTTDKAVLDSDRERDILSRSVPHGVFEGMVPKKGSSGLKVSLYGGTFAANGVIVEEGRDQSDLWDLSGADGAGGGRHYQMFVYLYNDDDPDPLVEWYQNNTGGDLPGYTKGEPYYGTIEASFTAPSDKHLINDDITRHTVFLGEAFVPNDALDLSDQGVRMVAHDRVPDIQTIWETAQTKHRLTFDAARFDVDGNGELTVQWRDMQFWGVSGQAGHLGRGDGPTVRINAFGQDIADTAPYDYDQEISLDLQGADGALVYFRGLRSDGADTVANYFYDDRTQETAVTDKLAIMPLNADGSLVSYTNDDIWRGLAGHSHNYTGGEGRPWRKVIDSILPVGYLRKVEDTKSGAETWVMYWSTGQVSVNGADLGAGRNHSYLHKLTSTAYGTQQSVDLSGGEIDLDEVIDNAPTLSGLGLDDAYDSAATGSNPGDGRTVQVDGGAVRLHHSGVLGSEDFPSTLQVHLNESGGVGQSVYQELGVEVLEDTNDVPDQDGAFVFRHPHHYNVGTNEGGWHDQNVTLIVEDGGDEVVLVPDFATFNGQEFLEDSLVGEDYLADHARLTFDGIDGAFAIQKEGLTVTSERGSAPYLALRRLEIDQAGNRKIAQPSTFGMNGGGDTTSEVATLWDRHVIDDVSSLLDLEVHKRLMVRGDMEVWAPADFHEDVTVQAATKSDTFTYNSPKTITQAWRPERGTFGLADTAGFGSSFTRINGGEELIISELTVLSVTGAPEARGVVPISVPRGATITDITVQGSVGQSGGSAEYDVRTRPSDSGGSGREIKSATISSGFFDHNESINMTIQDDEDAHIWAEVLLENARVDLIEVTYTVDHPRYA